MFYRRHEQILFRINNIGIPDKKSLNERNDLVETLRHENAGLKEKLSRLSQNDREKKPKKKRKSRDYNPAKDESYHGQGDEVIEIIHQKKAQNVQAVLQNEVTSDPSKLSANVQQSTSENTVQFSNSSKTMMSHSTEDSLNGPVNERLVYASGQKR